MKRALYLITLILAAQACCCPRHCPHAQTDVRDSIVIRDSLSIRDSVVLVHIPVEDHTQVLPDSDTSRLRTGIARSEAWVSAGLLHHHLENIPGAVLPVNVSIPYRVHTEYNGHLSETVRIVEVERQLTPWQVFSIMMGNFFMFVIVCCILVMIVRYRLLK